MIALPRDHKVGFGMFTAERIFPRHSRCQLCLASLAIALSISLFKATATEETILLSAAGSELSNLVVKAEGEVHRLDLAAGTYVELRLHRNGDPILLVQWSNSARQNLIETRTGRYDDLVLKFIAANSESYYLTVTPFDKDSIGSRYDLHVDNLRIATDEDVRVVHGAEAFEQAEGLRARWNENDLRTAMSKYGEAFAAWQTGSYRHEATVALQSIGELHFMLSEYKLAIDYFDRARQNARQHKDPVGEIEALDNIGYVHIYLSEYSRAIPYFNQALAIRKRVPATSPANTSERLQAVTLNNLGEAHYSLGDLKKSMDFFNRALALWSAAGDRRGQALAELNLGYTYYDMGDTELAAVHYEKSLSLWKVIDDRRGEALARTALGGIYSFIGKRQLALESHMEASKVLQVIGDRQGQAAALNGLGRVYEESNDLKTALDNYEHALQLYQAIGSNEFEALAEYYVGRVQRAMNNPEAALEHYERSISLSRSSRNRRLQAYAERGVATIYDSQGDKTRALNLLSEVLRLYRQVGDRHGQAQTLNNIGLIHQSSQQFKVAKQTFYRALDLNREGDDRVGEAATRFNLAQTERNLGSTAEALAQIKEAMKIIESLRSSLAQYELRNSYFALMQEYYAFYVDLLIQLYKQNSDPNFLAMSFEASESARARSLLEMLTEARASIREGVSEELLSRERNLQQQLSVRAKYYLRLKNNERTEDEAIKLEKEVRQLANEYSEVEAQIRAQSPRYANLTQPELPDTRKIQAKLLDDQTVLLEYFLGDEKSYLWLLSNTSLQVYELPKRSELEAATRQIYELITARQPVANEQATDYQKRVAEADAEYWRQATMLSQVLLGPVAGQIAGKRLLLITDGALQYIPFEALPDPTALKSDSTEPNPLILAHEIVSLPSASTLYSLRQETPQSVSPDRLVAVFSDPVFSDTDPRVTQSKRSNTTQTTESAQIVPVGISERDAGVPNQFKTPRLPSTRFESDAIMAFVPQNQGMIASGFEANRSRLLSSDLSRYQILHFATHGVIDSEHPELSGIILSMVNEDGSSADGFFQLHDIYNLKLSAKLVVLSACNSGLGKNVRGEGFIGLTRAFMYAGAHSTVASLWKVDDNATTELMRNFYSAMLQQGMSPAAALKSAKVKMSKHPTWGHPFYWAAFVLQGEYLENIKLEQREYFSASNFSLMGLCIIVLATGVYLTHRFRRKSDRLR